MGRKQGTRGSDRDRHFRKDGESEQDPGVVLPPKLFARVFAFVPFPGLLAAAGVSKRWSAVLDGPDSAEHWERAAREMGWLPDDFDLDWDDGDPAGNHANSWKALGRCWRSWKARWPSAVLLSHGIAEGRLGRLARVTAGHGLVTSRGELLRPAGAPKALDFDEPHRPGLVVLAFHPSQPGDTGRLLRRLRQGGFPMRTGQRVAIYLEVEDAGTLDRVVGSLIEQRAVVISSTDADPDGSDAGFDLFIRQLGARLQTAADRRCERAELAAVPWVGELASYKLFGGEACAVLGPVPADAAAPVAAGSAVEQSWWRPPVADLLWLVAVAVLVLAALFGSSQLDFGVLQEWATVAGLGGSLDGGPAASRRR